MDLPDFRHVTGNRFVWCQVFGDLRVRRSQAGRSGSIPRPATPSTGRGSWEAGAAVTGTPVAGPRPPDARSSSLQWSFAGPEPGGACRGSSAALARVILGETVGGREGFARGPDAEVGTRPSPQGSGPPGGAAVPAIRVSDRAGPAGPLERAVQRPRVRPSVLPTSSDAPPAPYRRTRVVSSAQASGFAPVPARWVRPSASIPTPTSGVLPCARALLGFTSHVPRLPRTHLKDPPTPVRRCGQQSLARRVAGGENRLVVGVWLSTPSWLALTGHFLLPRPIERSSSHPTFRKPKYPLIFLPLIPFPPSPIRTSARLKMHTDNLPPS